MSLQHNIVLTLKAFLPGRRNSYIHSVENIFYKKVSLISKILLAAEFTSKNKAIKALLSFNNVRMAPKYLFTIDYLNFSSFFMLNTIQSYLLFII